MTASYDAALGYDSLAVTYDDLITVRATSAPTVTSHVSYPTTARVASSPTAAHHVTSHPEVS